LLRLREATILLPPKAVARSPPHSKASRNVPRFGSQATPCRLPEHRQECLCHTSSLASQHSARNGRVRVAQTLLSVLVKLRMPVQLAFTL